MRTASIASIASSALLAALTASATAIDLGAIQDQSTVALVTTGRKSGLERRVTIWFVQDAGRVYVQSGKEGKTDWYRNLRGKPEVTLEFEGLTLRGTAHVVEDAAETERVHQLFRDKYLRARVMSWFGGGFGQGKVVLVDGLEAVGSSP